MMHQDAFQLSLAILLNIDDNLDTAFAPEDFQLFHNACINHEPSAPRRIRNGQSICTWSLRDFPIGFHWRSRARH